MPIEEKNKLLGAFSTITPDLFKKQINNVSIFCTILDCIQKVDKL